MTCDVCQRRLLASKAPADPGPEVRAHLGSCPECARWHRSLVQIERNVSRLPVPTTHARQPLLARILGQTEPAPAPPPAPVLALPWWRKPFALRAMVAAAAGFLITCGVILGLMLMHRRGPETPLAEMADPDQDLVARLAGCDVRLAEADTPQKRVEALAELADALRQEGQALRGADGGRAELTEVAGLYERVIREGVVPRARTLPADERRAVLDPIVKRLGQAEQEARALARGPAAEPLLQIAAAARAGDRELRKLLEATP